MSAGGCSGERQDGATSPARFPAGGCGWRQGAEDLRKMTGQGLPEPGPAEVPTAGTCPVATSEGQGTSQSSASGAAKVAPTTLKAW